MTALEKRYVESGCFVVSESRDLILEAVLGTCVGVAVMDKKARIAGLYHILLARHPNGMAPFPDEVYADRGMPKFLQALRDAGASPERMEAVLAGGALIGTLSRLDMHLDIGGRTMEIVQQMLKESSIPVVQAETGGFFGTRLQLNLRTMACSMEPAYPAQKTGKSAVAKLTEEDLVKAISRIKPIPQIALKIIRTFQSGSYNLRDIALQIRRDQVIAAKVLKLCNSVYVSPQREIKSIDQAIVILGAQIVVHLILASAMENFLKTTSAGYSMSKGGVYHHAIAAGIVSEHIARTTGRATPDVAYTAGLLHDIGKVVLDQYVGAALPNFYRTVYADGKELLQAERELLGITHSEAGARLAKLWSFPAPLVNVIAYHAEPELSHGDSELTHVVYLANLLLSRFDTCRELECVGIESLHACLQTLGLNAESLPDLISGIPWKSLHTYV